MALRKLYFDDVQLTLVYLDTVNGVCSPVEIPLQAANGNDGTNGTDGTDGTNGTNGTDGFSAYDIAVSNGFVGTETEWLATLGGIVGPAGPSAYQLALNAGFVGTEAEWLASLTSPDLSPICNALTTTFDQLKLDLQQCPLTSCQLTFEFDCPSS